MLRRSAPIMTLSLASSKSRMSTFSLLLRAASSAASFTRFSRSAPANPGVERASTLTSTSVRQRHLPRVHLQDSFAPLDVRSWHDNAADRTARAEQRGIQYVGPIGCGDENDAFVGLEAVHFDQQLVQRLFAFVMAATEAGAAMTPDGVDFVDEDDAGRLLLALNEQIAHTRRADADEHFDEIGTADAEERHPGFARDGTSQQSLAGSRRAQRVNTLWEFGRQVW